jgi:trehalose/maltose hydrolase-like predicted phosphorylase
VVGPDEYHEGVDDNAFTNLMARWNLRRAAALEPREADAWLALADSLVDGYDPATGRHEQFVGYSDLEPMLVRDLGTPPLAADLLIGPERLSRTQIIKQPDVLMAHHLIPDDLPAGSLAADLDHYLPRTSHGSSLSPAVVASLLARAGRPDDAMPLLEIALRMDLDDVTGMTASGLHLATLAGVWHALLFGFAGARVRDGALLLDPALPGCWGSLTLRFRCLGRTVEVQLHHDSARVTSTGPLPIGTSTCPPGGAAREAHLFRTDDGWLVNRP